MGASWRSLEPSWAEKAANLAPGGRVRTCLARGRKAHLLSERNRSMACPFLPSIFPSGGSLGSPWWHIGALLGYLKTAVGFLGARMSSFPNFDSPSVLGASSQELQSEPALVSLKQTSGRGPKTRETQKPSSTYGTSLVFSPFGPPAARMPCFPVWTVHLCSSWRPLRPSGGHSGPSWIALGPS